MARRCRKRRCRFRNCSSSTLERGTHLHTPAHIQATQRSTNFSVVVCCLQGHRQFSGKCLDGRPCHRVGMRLDNNRRGLRTIQRTDLAYDRRSLSDWRLLCRPGPRAAVRDIQPSGGFINLGHRAIRYTDSRRKCRAQRLKFFFRSRQTIFI